jgi:hypothetical protein|tara:strand:- start:84 stop:413 length:330 start_codon:yes stop_codon:yes gene_type:complete
MEAFNLDVDNRPNIKFTGERIAHSGSSPDTASSDYSGTTGRYTKLDLYKTQAGKFVCHKIGYSQWQGEHTRYTAEVCDTEAEVMAWFGHGWIAKDLYYEAGIDNSVTID